PYTGALVPDAAAGTRDFMRTVTRWHRTLAGEGNGARATAVDLANVLFLFMVVSGLYLWLPAVWRWRTVKGLVLFRGRYVNSKVRDFNWHHVFGVWALIPLFLITSSGVVISYPWASALVYRAYGEQPPQRRGPPEAAARQRGARPADADTVVGPKASLDVLLTAARAQATGWQRLTIPSNSSEPRFEATAELKGGGPRPPRQTIVLNSVDASLVSVSGPASGNGATPSPAQRARTWLRFIHTGEQYGVVGQTIAGLASLAACFLVYTGLALAWRRLVVPVWKRRKHDAYAGSTV
ncbi:MAG: PepSY domain-containing protein, partial [Proteobacteria bacterium]